MQSKILSCAGIFLIILGLVFSLCTSKQEFKSKTTSFSSYNTEKYLYLSDIDYISDLSSVKDGYSILRDKTTSNDLISLYVDGQEKSFIKGMNAWATSTLIYNLSEYEYDYFTSYLGVDKSQQNTYYNNGVTFYIYTSNDGENWTEVFKTDTLKGWDNAVFVKVDIKEAKYLKLYAYENGNSWYSQWYDEAVYADAKLIKEDYVEDTSTIDFINTIAEYDETIKKLSSTNEINNNYELTLLQREFVNNVGYDLLQSFAKCDDDYKNTLKWLMNDRDALRYYILGGEPNGSYIESLKLLSNLYSKYQDDFTKDDLYLKMAISLSLTHSSTVRFWINDQVVNTDGTLSANSDPTSPNISNVVERYAIYKKMYLSGKLDNSIFEQLEVEEMRYIMGSDIPDDEVEWLRNYTEQNGSKNPYSYLTYTTTVSYWNNKYYSDENKLSWDSKYNFSNYGIGYKAYYPRLWIVFEEGGVCWQISNTGQNIYSSYGIPSTTVGQPGHVAYLVYSLNPDGDGMWNLWNDVSGWTKTNDQGYSNYRSYYSIRWINGWGSGSYASSYPGSYILLGQAAINDFTNYKEAEELLMLANSYSDDETRLEEIYRDALKKQRINFDTWYDLVSLYINQERSEQEYFQLATEIADALTYYPLPMYDLLRIIEKKFTSVSYQVKYNLLLESTLKVATDATDDDVLQPTPTKTMAKYLLGIVDTEMATFSFDGDHAGTIVLSSRFDENDVRWDYSLDGGQTWTATSDHEKQLTSEEIKSITDTNDIKIHIVGVNYEKDNIYTIDIKKATTPTGLYNNDLENKVIGITENMEWKYSEGDIWTSYKDNTPDLTGNRTIIVRAGATGIYLPSDSITYYFTEDNQEETQKYIPISHLTVDSVSSEATNNNGYATYAIDGNINTLWHSNWNGTDTERYIVIKLDSPVYLSALQYVPRQSGNNGRIKNAQVLVSMDGINWTEAGTVTNWSDNANAKTIAFNDSIEAQYVKLVSTAYYGDGRSFISAAMINLFEDTTKKKVPTAGIEYSTKAITNQDVIATLVDSSTDITITNNNGKDSYVFTENGTFTFEFIDKNGNTGTSTAVVDWIDKVAPSASIQYSDTNKTSNPVTVTLADESEKITILNNNGQRTYTFLQNGTFEFIYQDQAGNIGKTTAVVDWIVAEIKNENIVNSTNITTSVTSNVNTIQESKNMYDTYSTGNITLKVLANTFEENVILKSKKLTLDNALQKKFGSQSEYFELYFDTENHQKIDVNSIPMKIIITLDSTKKFLGVYQVGKNDVLESLNYQKIGNDQIEIEVSNLEKYIIAYEEKKTKNQAIELEEKDNEKETWKEKENQSFSLWTIVGVILLTMLVFISVLIRRKTTYFNR